MTPGTEVDSVPWWGRASSLLAPVLLIGGWTLAAAHQAEFDGVRRTISELAALDATDRWIMTAGIAGTGVCHVVTAAALRPAARAGRVVLAVGGVATVLVAAFPLPAGGGTSTTHGTVALVAFVALSTWPFASWRRDGGAPWGLRRAVAVSAGAVLTGLVVAFGTSFGPGTHVGLAERLAAGAQALWPLAVVASVPLVRRGRRLRP
jgi:hypothetical membrane protein